MDSETVLGLTRTNLIMGGMVYELKPLTPRMTGDMFAYARNKAIKEFYSTAKECGLPFDMIRTQLDHMNNPQNCDEFLTLDNLAYLVYLRGKDSGVSIEDAMSIPLNDIARHQGEIRDEEPEVVVEAGDDKKKETP